MSLLRRSLKGINRKNSNVGDVVTVVTVHVFIVLSGDVCYDLAALCVGWLVLRSTHWLGCFPLKFRTPHSLKHLLQAPASPPSVAWDETRVRRMKDAP